MLVFNGAAEKIQFSSLFLLGTFLTGLGGYIRYSCYRELGRLFTFEMSIRKDHKLVTSGPYSIVRHPGYTGAVLTVVGIICWHACSVCVNAFFSTPLN
jgi:protein-S-isoprenylcysteine O-methyltransferase Ste14